MCFTKLAAVVIFVEQRIVGMSSQWDDLNNSGNI